jgi:gas vesicle protein
MGVVLNYYAKDVTDSSKASLTILDKDRKEIRTFTTDAKEQNNKIDISKGMNQAVWNLRYPESERIEGMILWNGVPGGIVAPPGSYFAKVKMGKDSAEVPFSLKADPNYKLTQAEYEQQFSFLKTVQEKFNETQKSLKDIRSLRTQINDFVTKQGKDVPKEVKKMADTINKQLTIIEEILYQTKAKSGQDVLNYPIRLNDKLSGVFDVANSGNTAPSKQAREVYADLAAQIDAQIAKLKTIKEKDIPAFNALIREKALPVIKPAAP